MMQPVGTALSHKYPGPFSKFHVFSTLRKGGRGPVATEECSGRRPTAKIAKVAKDKPKAGVVKEKLKTKMRKSLHVFFERIPL